MRLRVTRRLALALLLGATLSGSVATASNHIYFWNLRVTGTGLVIPGVLSVSTRHPQWKVVGWIMIVAGSMVSMGSLSSRETIDVDGREAWGHMVRESNVYRRHPELIADDTEFSAAARVMHVEPAELARLVTELDARDLSEVTRSHFPDGFRDTRQARGYHVLTELARAR